MGEKEIINEALLDVLEETSKKILSILSLTDETIIREADVYKRQGDALCAPYQRDYRRDQCHSFFRTLYRSGSKRLPDPDDKPHEVPVFSYIHPGTAAV